MDPRLLVYIALAAVIFAGGYGLRHLQASADQAELGRKHAVALGKIIKERDDETQKVRAIEARKIMEATKTRDLHALELSQRDILIDGLRAAEARSRATSDQLRIDLRAFTASRRPSDPACPSDPRPAALGLLLDEALGVIEANNQVAGELAAGAERHAGEVRVLLHDARNVCRSQQ